MNKRHYEHTLPNIRGSLSNTYLCSLYEEIIINSLTSLLRSKPADASKPGIPEELPYRCR